MNKIKALRKIDLAMFERVNRSVVRSVLNEEKKNRLFFKKLEV